MRWLPDEKSLPTPEIIINLIYEFSLAQLRYSISIRYISTYYKLFLFNHLLMYSFCYLLCDETIIILVL